MPWRDHLFLVEPAAPVGDGWAFAVVGRSRRTYGPFDDPAAAEAALHDLFARWRRAARARGGFLWRQTAWRWVATLPEELPCEGLPFASEACTRHGGG